MLLVASKGAQGEARVTVETLLQASMRLRPDRIFLGEICGAEAYSFLRAINTGHPGSITTVRADSPAGAFEQLALTVMQAGLGLRRDEIVGYIRSVLPIVIHNGRRRARHIGGAFLAHGGTAGAPDRRERPPWRAYEGLSYPPTRIEVLMRAGYAVIAVGAFVEVAVL